MAAKPLTNEAIALTEKKMDMTLDDIIKMSKSTTNKDKKQRIPNKSAKFLNNAAQVKTAQLRQFMNSKSSLRQGALAQRRSNFQGNQFHLATEAARKAAVAPIRNRPFNRSRAVDMIKPRVVGPPVQRRAANGGFAVKRSQQASMVLKQRPQTLDSLFANMKEQRMRVSAQHNNGGRQTGGGRQRQQWGRGRFGN
ncbi:uncharacterized protein LOC132308203 [Cornus florida]|uniref:uncharacterized protein LOC132308203 n=1 Tax=Cornus florida TaxID=4283 RepID=UPI00289E7D5D|nr:uncharacterized protein LOC132308203 [Cornus florida]